MFVDPEHERYPDNIWYRAHEERNFDLVNLGSSGGKWSFDYEGYSIKAMNWANQPQTLIDDVRLFKNFHSILRKGGKVLLVIMPFTGLNKCIGMMDVLKYVGTLDWTLLDSRFRDQAVQYANNPILFKRPALKALVKHWLGFERMPKMPKGAMENKNPMTSSELEKDAQHWIDGWANQFSITNFEAPLTQENQRGREVRIGVMRELVDFITERGYEPVFVIPPVASALARKFTPEFRKKYYYDFLQQVNRKIKTLDYLDDSLFADDNLYFNSFFLNMRGRKLFTRRVLENLGLVIK